MTQDIQLFSGSSPLQNTLTNLHAEIISFIEKRFADYDSCMEIPSREYFAEKIDDFLSSFSSAMSDCCTQLKGIARKVSKKLKVTLLNFYDYIARGLWLLRESPRCRENLEDFYFIPESFDMEGLKELIDDLITSAIMKLNESGIIKYKNDWQYVAYVLIEFCKWENSPNAVYAKFESLGFTDASVFSVPCVRDSLLKDFCFRNLETLQKSSTLDKASNAKYLIAKTLKEELEKCCLA